MRSPSRTTSWSSTTRTRIGAQASGASSRTVVPVAGGRVDRELAAEPARALLHRREPEPPRAHARSPAGRSRAPSSRDLEHEPPVGRPEPEHDARRARVADRVLQRLLRDPQQLAVAAACRPAARRRARARPPARRPGRGAAPRRACAASSRARRARARAGAARGSGSAAPRAPPARARAAGRSARAPPRGRRRAACPPTRPSSDEREELLEITSCSSSASRLRSSRIESSRLRSYSRAFVTAIAAWAASSSISSWSPSRRTRRASSLSVR